MRRFELTYLSAVFIIAAASCQRLELTQAEKVLITSEVSAPQGEKTHIEADRSITWSSTGESLKILETATSAASTLVSVTTTDPDYSVSKNGKNARFTFSLNKSQAQSFRYVEVCPSSAYVNANTDGSQVRTKVPQIQKPLSDSPDAAASILAGCSELKDSQPESLPMTLGHRSAYGLMSLVNCPLSSGEKAKSVEIEASSAVLAGTMQWVPTQKGAEPYGSSNSCKISLDCTNITTGSSMVLWFGCIPCTMKSGDKLKVTLVTDKASYTRNISLNSAIEFESGKISKFSVDMTGADSGYYYSKSWLSGYEMPGSDVTFTKKAVNYNGRYCHSTVNETHGSTKACIYNTATNSQRIVTHTFEYNGKIQRTYTMLYDKNKRCALWCAFAMHKSEFPDKGVSRNDSWGYDPAIDESWQPNLSGAYSNYTRGHQVASEDRQTSKVQNKQTFYYSNMTPQASSLNSGSWNVLEQEVQKNGYSTTGYDTLYVVTGPLFIGTYKTTTDKSKQSCPVPTHYFKCTMKCTFNSSGKMTNATGAGYLFLHNGTNAPRQTVSIDSIEEMSGFDFFANVPAKLQDAAEK